MRFGANTGVERQLEGRVHQIALSAWNKRAEIAKYADVKKYPAGQKRYVALYEHPVTWTYRPFIQIMVGKVKCPPLEIVIDVTFKFDQAVLVIDGGRVMAMEPGKVTVEGSARIGKAKLCEPVRKELGELPGSISFGAGLPIGKDPLLRLTDAHAGAG